MGWHTEWIRERRCQGQNDWIFAEAGLPRRGYVKQGDLLFEIDPRPFVASLDQAKSQLQEAQATLLGVEQDAKRAKELFQGKVISEQAYTNKTQDYQTKLAAVAGGPGGSGISTTEP